MYKKINTILFLSILLLTACSRDNYKPPTLTKSFKESRVPLAPDYSQEKYWVALPSKTDPADRVPTDFFKDEQATAPADVFFIYPTIYFEKPESDNHWNADLEDEKLNEEIRESTIQHQASIFNAAGKIYSPYYRQTHIYSYFAKESEAADVKQSFDLAYSDVKNAFEYYLENYNEGRPIIIASHSQGTTHGGRLLKEFFDNQALQEQLVAAYIIGMAIPVDTFATIRPCNSPTETGCFVSWRTYANGYTPDNHYENGYDKGTCVNPLSWRQDTIAVDYSENKGGVGRKFNKTIPGVVDAQCHEGMLWVNRPKVFGARLFVGPNYHIADLNFFYTNIRENAQQRVGAFLKKKK